MNRSSSRLHFPAEMQILQHEGNESFQTMVNGATNYNITCPFPATGYYTMRVLWLWSLGCSHTEIHTDLMTVTASCDCWQQANDCF